MTNQLQILSTKKLTYSQKDLFLRKKISVLDLDFIKIQLKVFVIEKSGDYFIFTSQNAVESVLRNNDINELKKKKCFCVGEKTRELLMANQFDVIACSKNAFELSALICREYSNNSFTFFCGNIRKADLPNALRTAKIKIDEVEVYQTLLSPHKIEIAPIAILFFSPSGVFSYLKENKINKEQHCFCIGYSTADALKHITSNSSIANSQTVESTLMKCVVYYT